MHAVYSKLYAYIINLLKNMTALTLVWYIGELIESDF